MYALFRNDHIYFTIFFFFKISVSATSIASSSNNASTSTTTMSTVVSSRGQTKSSSDIPSEPPNAHWMQQHYQNQQNQMRLHPQQYIPQQPQVNTFQFHGIFVCFIFLNVNEFFHSIVGIRFFELLSIFHDFFFKISASFEVTLSASISCYCEAQ